MVNVIHTYLNLAALSNVIQHRSNSFVKSATDNSKYLKRN